MKLEKENYEMNKFAHYFLVPKYNFEKVCNAAYADMARHTLQINKDKTANDKEIEKEKEIKKEKASKYLKERLLNLSTKNINNQTDYNDWHKETCQNLMSMYKDFHNKNNQPAFTFGQAQKWLNMLFKYLYVFEYKDKFKNYFDDRANLIPFLHVAIDTNIIDKAYEDLKLNKPSMAWSKMDEVTYCDYQNELRKKIEKNQNLMCLDPDAKYPFYWELIVWKSR